jgi:hypothetical protein
MSEASRAYAQRRIDAIDRMLGERRGYVGPLWPTETSAGVRFGAWLGRLGPGPNIDDLLEQRARWQTLLQQQR